jgi:hypothetical protein
VAIDAITVTLLSTVLGSTAARDLFKSIARKRIAEMTTLKADNPEAAKSLPALQSADLIGADSTGEKVYVTAKGLKVARDIESLPLA